MDSNALKKEHIESVEKPALLSKGLLLKFCLIQFACVLSKCLQGVFRSVKHVIGCFVEC